MTVIEVDGSRRAERAGKRLTLEEIRAAVGGEFKIDSTVTLDGVAHQCLVLVDEPTGMQNITASLICGRMVWGRAVFLIRGEEI